MKTIIWILAIYIVFYVAQIVQIAKQIMLNPLRKYKRSVCQTTRIPLHMRKQLLVAINQLEELEFKVSHFEECEELFVNVKQPIYKAIMYHPEFKCYAEIQNHFSPDATIPFKVSFFSISKNQIVMGLFGEASGIDSNFPDIHAIDLNEYHIEERFKEFTIYLEEYEKTNAQFERLKFSADDYCQFLNQSTSDYIDFLSEENKVYEKTGNFHFKLFSTLRAAKKIKSGSSKHALQLSKQKKLLIEYPEYLVGPEIEGFIRAEELSESLVFGKAIKTILFLASVILFALMFGSVFSFSFVLVLIPVLLFHELGHYVMMKIFGYRDLQILFLPFGAAAMGKEENTSTLKKVIIYLAGPVPGILLAFFLYGFFPDYLASDWFWSLLTILLILNYINLLPIMPMDGGQIINLVLFNRFPRVQFGFYLLSVSMFALGAFLLKDWLLWLFAVLLSIGIPAQYKHSQLMKGLKNLRFKTNQDLIAKIFSQLKNKPMAFAEKAQMVKAAIPQLKHPKAKVHEIILGLIFYITALFSPFILIYGMWNYQLNNFEYDPEISLNEYKEKSFHWHELILKTDDASKQLKIYADAILYLEEHGLYYQTSTLLDELLVLIESNDFQSHPRYPEILQTIMLNSTWHEPDVPLEKYLNQLISLIGEDDLMIAEITLAINGYDFDDSSLEKLNKALRIFELNKQQGSVLRIKNMIIHYHLHQKDYETATQLKTKLIEQSLEPSIQDYRDLGWIYLAQNKYQQALEQFNLMINLKNEPAKFYLSYLYTDIGWVYLLSDEYQQAEKYFTLSDDFNKKTNEQWKDEIGFVARLFISDGMDQQLDRNKYQKWFVLEWRRGNKGKAKQFLQKIIEVEAEGSKKVLKSNLLARQKQFSHWFSGDSMQTHLFIEAFEEFELK